MHFSIHFVQQSRTAVNAADVRNLFAICYKCLVSTNTNQLNNRGRDHWNPKRDKTLWKRLINSSWHAAVSWAR